MTTTNIEWADAVWNPVTGCTKVSAGCRNCYAETVARRFWKGRAFGDVQLHMDRLEEPLHWRKPRRIFVNSMSDLFHEAVPDEFISRVFDVMWKCPQHTFFVLTKRKRVAEWVRHYAHAMEHNWGDLINHYPMNCGDPFVIYNNELRNNCGWCYRVGGNDHNCQHPSSDNGSYCDAISCPIGYPIDSKDELLRLGYSEGDFYWTRGGDGEEYAEDPGLIRLHSRPMDAFCSNVWIGVSAEDQPSFDERVDWLAGLRYRVPHAVLFMSIEPLIGFIDASAAFEKLKFSPLAGSNAPASKSVADWIIVGGESGPAARPCNVEWIRSIVQQCKAASVPCFVKQLGGHAVMNYYERDDRFRDRMLDKNPTLLAPAGGLQGRFFEHVPPDGMGHVNDGQPPFGTICRAVLHDRKGADMSEWPEDLQVRQWPEVKA